KAAKLLALGRCSIDVVGGQPVFIEPYIEEQDAEETCQVEDILLDGNGGAEGRGLDSEGCGGVGEDKEISGEEEVQQGAYGKEQTDGPEEAPLGDFDLPLRDQPEGDDSDRDDKQEKADSIAVGRSCGG